MTQPGASGAAPGRAGRLDRQRHDRHRHDDRRRHCPAPHRRGPRCDRQHRKQPPAHLRRRGHGTPLRLPRPDGGAGFGRELGVHPGEAAGEGRVAPGDVCGHAGRAGRAATQPGAGRRRARETSTETRSPSPSMPSEWEQRRGIMSWLEESTGRCYPTICSGPRPRSHSSSARSFIDRCTRTASARRRRAASGCARAGRIEFGRQLLAPSGRDAPRAGPEGDAALLPRHDEWSQLILLGVLVVVYVFNIKFLPLTAKA